MAFRRLQVISRFKNSELKRRLKFYLTQIKLVPRSPLLNNWRKNYFYLFELNFAD